MRAWLRARWRGFIERTRQRMREQDEYGAGWYW